MQEAKAEAGTFAGSERFEISFVRNAEERKVFSVRELMDGLKVRIVEALKLENVKPEDISDDAPLFGEGLGLDSIDALELAVMLEREYGILVKDMETGRKAFASVRSLAQFVQDNRKK